MRYLGDVWWSTVPPACYRKLSYPVTYKSGGYCAVQFPHKCLSFEGMVYDCNGIIEIDGKKYVNQRFVELKEYLLRFKELCFKQIILGMSWNILKLAYCAGWDLSDVILKLDKETLMKIGNTLGEALDHYLMDVNSLFERSERPTHPYGITIDEPASSDTFDIRDASLLYQHIKKERQRGNPLYSSINTAVSFDISEYDDIDDVIPVCDHILLSKYHYGGWWNPFTGFQETGPEGEWSKMKNLYGDKMRGSYINLLTNAGEFDKLFSIARQLGFSDIWLFPGADEDWKDKGCNEFYERCKNFCKSAQFAGYGEKRGVYEVHTTQDVYMYCTKYPRCSLCISEDDWSFNRPEGFPEIIESEKGYYPFTD
jgi:hypothetical protein